MVVVLLAATSVCATTLLVASGALDVAQLAGAPEEAHRALATLDPDPLAGLVAEPALPGAIAAIDPVPADPVALAGPATAVPSELAALYAPPVATGTFALRPALPALDGAGRSEGVAPSPAEAVFGRVEIMPPPRPGTEARSVIGDGVAAIVVVRPPARPDLSAPRFASVDPSGVLAGGEAVEAAPERPSLFGGWSFPGARPGEASGSHGPDGRPAQSGLASWYGPGFHGRRTASGEVFNQNDLTAAHRHLPFGTKVRVVDEDTGRSVVVRINDRGPFKRGRVIDLSRGSAQALGVAGLKRVKLVAADE